MRVLLAAILLGLAALPAAARRHPPEPPFLAGVVEGYYGRPWSAAGRQDVIRFLGAHGMDTFVYGPKNDPFHRDEWREPYATAALAELRETAVVARKASVRFVYALSPGLDVCYACRQDRRALRHKLKQLLRAGIRDFALFFDDGPGELANPRDLERFGGSGADALARAQATLTNQTARWLRRKQRRLRLVVPWDYAGTQCSPYSMALDEALDPAMPIGWTGNGVIPATITAAEATTRRACLGNRPLVLWDNYPVNDAILSSNLHLGPLTGRAPDLDAALGGGHLFNPMTQAHASLVALGTAAAYVAAPGAYDAEAAWHATLEELAPPGSLDVLAEQTRSSALDLDDAPALTAVVDQLEQTYGTTAFPDTVEALGAEAAREGAAVLAIDHEMSGTELWYEIFPWREELAAHALQQDVLARFLGSLSPAISATADAPAPDRHVSGRILFAPDWQGPLPDAPPAPALGDLLDCLGPLLTEQIGFCPQLGLNVHGKRLYVSLGAPIAVVTGRNRQDRLVEFARQVFADLLLRPIGSNVTITVNGMPVDVTEAGEFDTTVPDGPVTIVAAGFSGHATTVVLP